MTDDNSLHRYFLNNNGKVVHKWLHYFDIYERHFSRFRDKPIRMLEIGVFKGGSLQMWQNYFHKDSTIVGIDINPECKAHEGGNVHVRIGSQVDRKFLRKVITEFGPFDIILDDGSHDNQHVVNTFEMLYTHTSENGVYMVEDMHTSYWPNYGGGLRAKGSMIEYFKKKIDEINAVHVKENYPATNFTRSTDSMTFYDSILVLEKRRQGLRQDAQTLGMQESV